MRFLSQNPSSSSSYSSTTIFYLVIVIIMHYHKHGDAVSLPGNQTVPALFIFGDSIVDPGNNNNIKTIIKCNFPPYGRDFMGGKPTGRFCNGKVPSDILVQELGIKELLPAYLDPNLKPEDLVTGVSYASGGSGYDPLTSKIASVLSLSDQLDFLKKSLTKIEAMVGKEQTATILSKGVFIVCTGSDDIANTYFSTPFRRAHYDINSYTDLTVSEASKFFQELYGVGARRIGLLSLPPIGCVPVQRTLNGGIQRGCSEQANQAALLYNSKLSSLVDSLNQRYPDARFVYFDVYNPLLSIIQNPAQYGFEVATKGCCGTGDLEVSILCTRLSDPLTCKDDTKYVFWDSYHPTATAYQILTPTVLSNSITNSSRPLKGSPCIIK
ncbi:hypothetical protein Patl1_29137 [Pistacia atlantica]|uniref:Uncharacterized protein n=1 Tax=Pistacia atlantica TaxID=434234 RepID=A0ACC1BGM2_9ROSI|nr:hypothetical protein Patl1_29137 [Pistacia atlantica]